MSKKNPDQTIDELRSQLDEDRVFLAKTSSSWTEKLTLGKGEAAVIRFIPAEIGMGKKKTFYQRVGRHWFNKRPTDCRATTAKAFGGDPNHKCPVCEVVEKYRTKGKQIREIAGNFRAQVTFSFFGIVKEFGDRQETTVQKLSKVKIPKEFRFYRTHADEILNLYEKGLEKRKLSILDPDMGMDFSLYRGQDGKLVLRQSDRGPLIEGKTSEENDDLLEELVASISVREPEFDDDNAQEMADKVVKFMESAARGENADESSFERRSTSRNFDDDERPRSRRSTDEEDETPRRRPAAQVDEEEEEETPRPARRQEREEAPRPAARPAARTARDDDDDEDEEDDETEVEENTEDEEEETPAPRPVQARKAPTPPPSPSRPTSPPRNVIDDDDDEIPMEHHDPAPAARLQDEDHGEEPDAVEESPARPPKKNDLMDRLKKLNK